MHQLIAPSLQSLSSPEPRPGSGRYANVRLVTWVILRATQHDVVAFAPQNAPTEVNFRSRNATMHMVKVQAAVCDPCNNSAGVALFQARAGRLFHRRYWLVGSSLLRFRAGRTRSVRPHRLRSMPARRPDSPSLSPESITESIAESAAGRKALHLEHAFRARTPGRAGLRGRVSLSRSWTRTETNIALSRSSSAKHDVVKRLKKKTGAFRHLSLHASLCREPGLTREKNSHRTRQYLKIAEVDLTLEA